MANQCLDDRALASTLTSNSNKLGEQVVVVESLLTEILEVLQTVGDNLQRFRHYIVKRSVPALKGMYVDNIYVSIFVQTEG